MNFCSRFIHGILNKFQKHSAIYPTLSRIARDICAIPASSVPCEQLFSAGAEIATNCRSSLGSTRFEELQVLKHVWRNSLVDRAAMNSREVEVVVLQEYQELYERDQDMVQVDREEGVEVVAL